MTDGSIAFSAPIGDAVYVQLTGVDIDTDIECELDGPGVLNDQVTIVGLTGPFESDWSTSNNVCGVLFTIEDDVNNTDDELELTFG